MALMILLPDQVKFEIINEKKKAVMSSLTFAKFEIQTDLKLSIYRIYINSFKSWTRLKYENGLQLAMQEGRYRPEK